jgi:hypothetical protein
MRGVPITLYSGPELRLNTMEIAGRLVRLLNGHSGSGSIRDYLITRGRGNR